MSMSHISTVIIITYNNRYIIYADNDDIFIMYGDIIDDNCFKAIEYVIYI